MSPALFPRVVSRDGASDLEIGTVQADLHMGILWICIFLVDSFETRVDCPAVVESSGVFTGFSRDVNRVVVDRIGRMRREVIMKADEEVNLEMTVGRGCDNVNESGCCYTGEMNCQVSELSLA